MPWLEEEVPDWDDLSEEDRERLRAALADIGLAFSDDEDEDYYE